MITGIPQKEAIHQMFYGGGGVGVSKVGFYNSSGNYYCT